MKKLTFILVLILGSYCMQGQTWTLDKTHSSFTFSVVHLGLSKISGTFGEYSATITSADETFSDATIAFSLETASVNTYNEGRNGHLRKDDMFDAEGHPQITFKSTTVDAAGENKFEVVGDLTIKGVTKSITMDLTLNGVMDNKRSGGRIAGFTAATIINRKDFGVGNMPSMMVSEEVELIASGEFKNN